ncbi:MAG: hypothetical protein L0228_21500 [Planctomycetes bacterium]|nr:hypothetical protein [Planctomycetota bacterium]
MSELDDAYNAAESLDPDDRLRLIARLWASLPEEFWAAPSDRDRADVRAMLADDDTGQMAGLPRRIAWQVVGSPPETAKIYSAPRRFDLATIFVVTFAYSLLFAVMSGLNFPPVASLIVGGFITVVGAGQALLFGGKKPRLASAVTGAVVSVPLTLLTMDFGPRGLAGELWVLGMPASIIFGAGFGYAAGALVGGVFLVADAVRQKFARRARASADDAEVAEVDAD